MYTGQQHRHVNLVERRVFHLHRPVAPDIQAVILDATGSIDVNPGQPGMVGAEVFRTYVTTRVLFGRTPCTRHAALLLTGRRIPEDRASTVRRNNRSHLHGLVNLDNVLGVDRIEHDPLAIIDGTPSPKHRRECGCVVVFLQRLVNIGFTDTAEQRKAVLAGFANVKRRSHNLRVERLDVL